MKNLFSLILFFFCITMVFSQKTNDNYDAELAKKYGADDYGMKSYVMVILTTPADSTRAVPMTQELMRGHLDNINRLVKEGLLPVVGPFMQNEMKYRGLYIFDVKTVEEAKTLVESDPAIEAGVFDAIYLPWYGSAALKAYLEDSDKIWKINP